MILNSKDRKWVLLKWAQIRESQKAADKANKDYEVLSDAINDKLDREKCTDVVARADRRGSSLALAELMGAGNWHARNAERHIHDVNLFLRMKELNVL